MKALFSTQRKKLSPWTGQNHSRSYGEAGWAMACPAQSKDSEGLEIRLGQFEKNSGLPLYRPAKFGIVAPSLAKIFSLPPARVNEGRQGGNQILLSDP